MISAVTSLALLLAALPPAIHPWPIGTGPRYRPTPAPDRVRAGQPVAELHCGADVTRYAVHVELFANRRVIPVPAGIGVARPFSASGADVRPGGCVYPIHTTTPTGVVRVGGSTPTVGRLFRIWGQKLGPQRLLSFTTPTRVRAFVNGREQHGDPRSIRLTPQAQVVLEIGGYVPPHTSYLFPKGTP
jgi:hypothetical protein